MFHGKVLAKVAGLLKVKCSDKPYSIIFIRTVCMPFNV